MTPALYSVLFLLTAPVALSAASYSCASHTSQLRSLCVALALKTLTELGSPHARFADKAVIKKVITVYLAPGALQENTHLIILITREPLLAIAKIAGQTLGLMLVRTAIVMLDIMDQLTLACQTVRFSNVTRQM